MRRFLLVAVLAPLTVSCADPAGANGKFCDVVKRIQVTADPLSGAAAYSDPKVLADGMAVKVKAFADLAEVAPATVRSDTILVSESIRKIAEQLAAKGNKSSAANDPAIAALVKDERFVTASLNVQRFSEGQCAAPKTP